MCSHFFENAREQAANKRWFLCPVCVSIPIVCVLYFEYMGVFFVLCHMSSTFLKGDLPSYNRFL